MDKACIDYFVEKVKKARRAEKKENLQVISVQMTRGHVKQERAMIMDIGIEQPMHRLLCREKEEGKGNQNE